MTQQQRAQSKNAYLRRAAVLTACLGAISLLAAGFWLSELRLPNPATADREGLVRWLVMRDLGDEPLETRSTLLRRLQEEVQTDFDPAALRTRLDARYHQRIWSNTLVLLETWYSEKVDSYISASAPQRPASLDQTIAEIKQWKDLAALRPGTDSSETSRPSELALLELFAQQVTEWKATASPQREREISEFDAALRGRWILHALGLAPENGA